jgi:hypothetical protein
MMVRERKDTLKGERYLEEIELLPQALREQSLSEQEIVWPSHEALAVLELLVRARWALLGWEGWVKYPDGRHGQTPGGVLATESIEPEAGETWESYVQRSARECAETILKEHRAWDASPGSAHLVLCFCLTATPPEEEASPTWREGRACAAVGILHDHPLAL